MSNRHTYIGTGSMGKYIHMPSLHKMQTTLRTYLERGQLSDVFDIICMYTAPQSRFIPQHNTLLGYLFFYTRKFSQNSNFIFQKTESKIIILRKSYGYIRTKQRWETGVVFDVSDVSDIRSVPVNPGSFWLKPHFFPLSLDSKIRP